MPCRQHDHLGLMYATCMVLQLQQTCWDSTDLLVLAALQPNKQLSEACQSCAGGMCCKSMPLKGQNQMKLVL
jgi:hypothetical protein